MSELMGHINNIVPYQSSLSGGLNGLSSGILPSSLLNFELIQNLVYGNAANPATVTKPVVTAAIPCQQLPKSKCISRSPLSQNAAPQLNITKDKKNIMSVSIMPTCLTRIKSNAAVIPSFIFSSMFFIFHTPII